MWTRLSRLFSPGAIPGWILFIWKGAGVISRVEYLEKKMQAIWEFSLTSGGTVALILGGIVWLTVVVVWPELKSWWISAPTLAVSVIHSLVERREWAIKNLLNRTVQDDRQLERWTIEFEEWRTS